MTSDNLEIAILIPCYNEVPSIAKVVASFQASVPQARIYVYDNNSNDGTAEAARAAGACVRIERRQGKGYVVRRMFADIEADIYILVDGDDTYEAEAAPRLIKELLEGPYDQVNGQRIGEESLAARKGHRFGNWVFSWLVGFIFGPYIQDMLSGYKALSRRFVKSFPIQSNGFEIETELLVHALGLRVPLAEIPTHYRDRMEGSVSKLNTLRDGFRVLWLLMHLVKNEKPIPFFGTMAALFGIASLGTGAFVIQEFLREGIITHLPLAVLSTGLALCTALSLVSAFILEGLAHARRETKYLHYLSMPSVGHKKKPIIPSPLSDVAKKA